MATNEAASHEDDHDVIMSRREVFDLAIALSQWGCLARGDKGRGSGDSDVLRLLGRRLSHDIERASRLICELIGDETQSVNLGLYDATSEERERARLTVVGDAEMPGRELTEAEQAERREYEAWHATFMEHVEVGARIVDRLLGPEVLELWSYEISNRDEDSGKEDLIALAANSGDVEARELLARGCLIEAWMNWPLGHVLRDDQCVPAPDAVAAANAVLDRALGPAIARARNVTHFRPRKGR